MGTDKAHSNATQRPTSGLPALSRSPSRPNILEPFDDEASTCETEATVPLVAPVLARARAVMTVVTGPSAGRIYSVEGETVLGRGKGAQVHLDDPATSRAHARVFAASGRYVLEDLRSTNGTFVGGRRIERVELRSGDRIHVGPHLVLSFSIVDAQAERVAQQLYELSVRDPLTRAHNRRYLVERLDSEVAYARRHTTLLGLILLDLDRFKEVNDTHGHLAGDEVLRQVAAQVQRLIRAEDVFARFGGEEFVLLVRGITHDNLGRFADRVRGAVEHLEVASGSVLLRTTLSAGYASIHEVPIDAEPSTANCLLGLADERLYRAKAAGRNRVCGD